ncbi:rod shape-determining protein MreC [Haloimpatiens sp. FM7330]|uniref:rod shape-determining protein MreC n=1 Tax=Haloimpatiens sp. FM7330 TaxID=3298610 RepID=UPI003627386E
MKFFKKRLTVAIIVLSVALLGVIGYSIKRDKITVIENGVGNVLSSVQGVIYNVCSEAKNSIKILAHFSEVKNQNEKLIKDNQELKDKLTRYESLEDENKRLRDVLNYKDQNSEYKYVGCNISGKSSNGYLEGYIINRGKKDGIDKKMAVINSKGLIGKVTSVGSNWAVVQTIESENIAVGGYIARTKQNSGIIKGYRDKNNKVLARLSYLPLNSDIKVGDEVLTGLVNVTSKEIQPGIYPKGIKIGKVISVEEDKGKMMKSAVIEPYVDFDRIEEVFIVIPKVSRDIN